MIEYSLTDNSYRFGKLVLDQNFYSSWYQSINYLRRRIVVLSRVSFCIHALGNVTYLYVFQADVSCILQVTTLYLLVLFTSNNGARIISIEICSHFISFRTEVIHVFFVSGGIPLPPVDTPENHTFRISGSVVASYPNVTFGYAPNIRLISNPL